MLSSIILQKVLVVKNLQVIIKSKKILRIMNGKEQKEMVVRIKYFGGENINDIQTPLFDPKI